MSELEYYKNIYSRLQEFIKWESVHDADLPYGDGYG